MATLKDSSVLLAGENVLDSILIPAIATFGSLFSAQEESNIAPMMVINIDLFIDPKLGNFPGYQKREGYKKALDSDEQSALILLKKDNYNTRPIILLLIFVPVPVPLCDTLTFVAEQLVTNDSWPAPTI